MGSTIPARAWIALASVSFFWGTTYLAIRIALESFPPLLLVCYRFCLAGALMIAACKLSGYAMPPRRDMLRSILFGTFILGIGNMALTTAELYVASSFAALVVAASPFWMVGIEALLPRGEKLRRATVIGMLIGLAGVALLIVPGMIREGLRGNEWRGFLILQIGIFSWTLGSLLQKRYSTQSPPLVNAAFQQLGAGLLYIIPALLIPQKPIVWDAKGVGALVYLIIFGSIVGYSSYIYALSHIPVSVVSVYPYLNVIVAAVLGWLFYREPFGAKEITAMTIIFLGVGVVKRFSRAGEH
ncbi:MAG: EamA family transporter [Acidobacteriota bacterium]